MPLHLDSIVPVQQLLLRLFYALDTRDYATVVSSFRQDGVWARFGKQLVGPEQMMQALKQRPETLIIHHVITNLLFEEADESRCKLVCYLTAYRHDSGKQAMLPAPLNGPAQVGLCRAEAARNSAGERWLLTYLNADGPAFLSAAP